VNPLAVYPMAVTAASLVPVIMWITTWPLAAPTEAQAGAIAVLIMALGGCIHAWLAVGNWTECPLRVDTGPSKGREVRVRACLITSSAWEIGRLRALAGFRLMSFPILPFCGCPHD
jgi:hypothetical protein